MAFGTLSFIVLFALPAVLLYFACKKHAWQNGVLTVASLIFYAWGEPVYLLLLLALSAVAYASGLALPRLDARAGAKKALLACTIIVLSLALFICKYLGFVLENTAFIFGIAPELEGIVLPLGISFYTFQLISYVCDVFSKKTEPEKNPFDFLLYVTFFPQLIVGPIVRYPDVKNALKSRTSSVDGVASGIRRFALGFFKKAVLSAEIAQISTGIYALPELAGTGAYWIAAVAYSLNLYFDFSGYSDMAIGLARIFGFCIPENFDHPYISRSVTEFWRRWHISLSSWFRDYVYIPMGGSRVGKARLFLNLLVVWAFTGLWHGAAWNFVLWGLYYFVLLVLEKFLFKKVLERLPAFFSWLITFALVVVGWVIFNISDLAQLGETLKTMFVFAPTDWRGLVSENSVLWKAFLFVPVGLIAMFPLQRLIKGRHDIIKNVIALVFFALGAVMIIAGSFTPFVYFRF